MKRFVIPAMIVVHADSQEEADSIAGKYQITMNKLCNSGDGVLLDEELPTKEINPNDEYPHSYKFC